MFRPVARRRGAPLLGAAVVGGSAYMMGKSAERASTAQAQQDQAQNDQIAQMQQQLAEQQAQQSAGMMPPQGMPQYAPQYAPPPPPPAPAPAPAPAPQPVTAAAQTQDPVAMLKQLGELKDAGVLTEDEFQAKKADLLRQI